MISNSNAGSTFPGLTLKAWALVTSAGALTRGFNVSSITKGVAGIYTVNFTTAFATANYMRKVQAINLAPSSGALVIGGPNSTGTSTINMYQGGYSDNPFYVEFWE